MSEHPGYECPEICEVDHIHLKKIPVLPELDSFTNIIKEEEDVRKNGSTNTKRQQGRDSGLYQPTGKYSTDWRKD